MDTANTGGDPMSSHSYAKGPDPVSDGVTIEKKGKQMTFTLPDEEQDTHSCAKCKLVFLNLQEYILHKLSRDNCKVSYSKSRGSKVLVPTITKVSSPEPKKPLAPGKKRGPKGPHKRPRLENVVEELPEYQCVKCAKRFRRKAALDRHVDFVHGDAMEDNEDILPEKLVEEETEEEENFDDKDQEYQPVMKAIKVEPGTDVHSAENNKGEEYEKVTMAPLNGGTGKVEILMRPSKSLVHPALDPEHFKVSADRPYECETCGKAFKDTNVLKTHLLTHTDEREYPCTWEGCSYAFKTKGSLKRHMRRHTGERPFRCELCSRCFGESGALTRHLKSRTPCVNKSDTDLPRYGQSSTFMRDIPAARGKTGELPEADLRTFAARVGAQEDEEEETIIITQPAGVSLTEEDIRRIGDAAAAGNQRLAGRTLQVAEHKVMMDENGDEQIIVVLQPTNEVTVYPQRHTCEVCHNIYDSKRALLEHLKDHMTVSNFRCDFCNYTGTSETDLSLHLRITHKLAKVNATQIQSAGNLAPAQVIHVEADDAADGNAQTTLITDLINQGQMVITENVHIEEEQANEDNVDENKDLVISDANANIQSVLLNENSGPVLASVDENGQPVLTGMDENGEPVLTSVEESEEPVLAEMNSNGESVMTIIDENGQPVLTTLQNIVVNQEENEDLDGNTHVIAEVQTLMEGEDQTVQTFSIDANNQVFINSESGIEVCAGQYIQILDDDGTLTSQVQSGVEEFDEGTVVKAKVEDVKFESDIEESQTLEGGNVEQMLNSENVIPMDETEEKVIFEHKEEEVELNRALIVQADELSETQEEQNEIVEEDDDGEQAGDEEEVAMEISSDDAPFLEEGEVDEVTGEVNLGDAGNEESTDDAPFLEEGEVDAGTREVNLGDVGNEESTEGLDAEGVVVNPDGGSNRMVVVNMRRVEEREGVEEEGEEDGEVVRTVEWYENGVQIKQEELEAEEEEEEAEEEVEEQQEQEKGKRKKGLQIDASRALQQTLALHSGPRSSKVGSKTLHHCPVCTRSFQSSHYLKLHLRSHIGERPHTCQVCKKNFMTRDSLIKHMVVHSNERNYKCGECGKLFKRISHVREHLKVHSVDRPYPCLECNKTFKSANACKVHMRTHTDVLPHECRFCHRHFREKGSLQRHMRTHTGEKPYNCQYCNRAFAEHGTLNRHLKAKVPCNGNPYRGEGRRSENGGDDTENTVLAEFSTVVADTQQYIVSDITEEQQQEPAQSDEVATEDAATTSSVMLFTNPQVYEAEEEEDQDLATVQLDTSLLQEGEYVIVGQEDNVITLQNKHTGHTINMPASAVSVMQDGGEEEEEQEEEAEEVEGVGEMVMMMTEHTEDEVIS